MDPQRQNPQAQQIVTEQPVEQAVAQADVLDAKLKEILQKLCPGDAKRQQRLANAMRQLLREAMVSGEVNKPEEIKALLYRAIVNVRERVQKQTDAILHTPELQQLESCWRGLKFLTSRTNFDAAITIDLVDASKATLNADFKRHDDFHDTAYRRMLYADGIGIAGGDPYAAVIGVYDFDARNEEDVELLRRISEVAEDTRAPFIAAASPTTFGLESHAELPDKKLSPIVRDIEKSDAFIKWRALRETSGSRYLCLTMPRFVLRSPWGEGKQKADGKMSFYVENTHGARKNFLWGNTAFALATRLTDQFDKYGWYDDITGWEEGGRVESMEIPIFELPGEQRKIATEALVTDEMEYVLSTLGFTPLIMELKSDRAYFQSAPTLSFAGSYPDTEPGRKAQERAQMGTQLTYMLLASRVAHYLKVQQRRLLGSPKTAQDIDKSIRDWLGQYWCADPKPLESTRRKKPLRFFDVKVEPISGQVGYYDIKVNVVPFTRYRGADITLELDAEPPTGGG